jgi:hypothetical protein
VKLTDFDGSPLDPASTQTQKGGKPAMPEFQVAASRGRHRAASRRRQLKAPDLDVWWHAEQKQEVRLLTEKRSMKKILCAVVLMTAAVALADDTMQKAGANVDKAAADTAAASKKAATGASKATTKAATKTSAATQKAASSSADATKKAAAKSEDAVKKTANDVAPVK